MTNYTRYHKSVKKKPELTFFHLWLFSDGEDVRKSKTPTPEVDEDGYSKQPDRRGTSSDPWADFNRPTDKFYSSSDESGKKVSHFFSKNTLLAMCLFTILTSFLNAKRLLF